MVAPENTRGCRNIRNNILNLNQLIGLKCNKHSNMLWKLKNVRKELMDLYEYEHSSTALLILLLNKTSCRCMGN